MLRGPYAIVVALVLMLYGLSETLTGDPWGAPIAVVAVAFLVWRARQLGRRS